MTDYYVDNTIGNDNSYSGTSLTQPFKSINAAVAKARTPGDTIYVRGRGTNYTGSDNIPIVMTQKGTSGNYITLKAYNNETVVVDGAWSLPTGREILPGATDNDGNRTTCTAGTPFVNEGMIDLKGEYLWVEGIEFRRSKGRTFRVFTNSGQNGVRAKYITIKNCTSAQPLAQGLITDTVAGVDRDGTTQLTIDGCDFNRSGWYLPQQHSASPCNWMANVSFTGASYVTIKNTKVWGSYGEGIIADTHKRGTHDITIQDCEFYDNMAGYVSFHGVRNAILERSKIYYTGETSSGFTVSEMVTVIPAEEDQSDPTYWSDNVTIRNNIFVRGQLALACRGRGIDKTLADGSKKIVPKMGNLYVYNNTFLRNTTGFWTNQIGRKAGAKTYIKNNIFYRNFTHAYAVSGAGGSIVADYNHWESTPSDSSFQGANDVTGNPSMVNSGFNFTRGDLRAENARLGSGSSAIDQGADLSASFTVDFWNNTRTGTWDMGFHEYDGVSYPTPTASASASTTTPDAGDTVTFTGGASGGTAPYTYSWTFGDGDTSTDQNPTHIYTSDGTYVATLRIEDANSLVDTDTVTINVFAEPQSGGGATTPADIEQVTFAAAATYFTTTRAPEWIMFFATGASADDTATSDAKIAVGFHDVGGNQSYCFAGHVEDAVSVSNVAEQMHTDKAIVVPASNGTAAGYATVTSVTANTVALSWSGTTSSETVLAWCGVGTAFQDVLATVVPFTTNGTGVTISGDYTHAIFPTTFRDDGNQGIIDFSFGIAVRGGDQMCVAWHSRDNQSTASTKAGIFNDRIGHRPQFADYIQVTAWSTGGITLTPYGRDLNASCPILLLKVDTDKVSTYLGIEDVATSTGTGTYALGFDPAAAMAVLTTLTAANTIKDDSSSGVLGFAFVDDAGTDRSLQIYDKDGASPTVAKSYTDDTFTIKDYAGTTQATGTMSISGTNLLINLGTAPSSAYKMLVFALQEGATPASGPTSAWSHDVTSTTTYEDVITVQDLSVSDGVNALDNFQVQWGDGTAKVTGFTPGGTATYTYSAPGNYTIVHTIVDAGTNWDYSTKDVTIGTPQASVSFTASPLTGTAPLTVTLDASASDAGGTEVWNRFEWNIHNIESSSQVGVGAGTFEEEGLYSFFLTGTTVTATLPSAAEWTVGCTGYTDKYDADSNTPSTAWDYKEERITVTNQDFTLDFRNEDGEMHVYGTYTANFSAYVNAEAENTEFEWTLGDGTTTGTYGLSTLTHTYSAVVTATNYTVVVTATLPDGETVLTATRANYINMYPTPVAPLTIEELYNDLVEVKKHLGILYGATWTQEGSPNTNVYGTTVTNVQWASGYGTYTLKENGTALSSQASIADCQANAGSYYISYSGGTLTIYVHPTGSTSPTTNGNYYRWIGS